MEKAGKEKLEEMQVQFLNYNHFNQNFFDKIDGTKMLLTVLSESNTSLIVNELLENFLTFGITILDEGNPRVQQTIYHFCKNFSRSEMMFAKFNIIISEEIIRLNSTHKVRHNEL